MRKLLSIVMSAGLLLFASPAVLAAPPDNSEGWVFSPVEKLPDRPVHEVQVGEAGGSIDEVGAVSLMTVTPEGFEVFFSGAPQEGSRYGVHEVSLVGGKITVDFTRLSSGSREILDITFNQADRASDKSVQTFIQGLADGIGEYVSMIRYSNGNYGIYRSRTPIPDGWWVD